MAFSDNRQEINIIKDFSPEKENAVVSADYLQEVRSLLKSDQTSKAGLKSRENTITSEQKEESQQSMLSSEKNFRENYIEELRK